MRRSSHLGCDRAVSRIVRSTNEGPWSVLRLLSHPPTNLDRMSSRPGGDKSVGTDARIEVDFQADLRAYVLSTLPHEKGAHEELEADSTSELLIHYFNWYCRLVPQARRRVHKSRELKRKLQDSPTATRRAIREIEEDISRGNDLTRYLSRGIRYGYISRKNAPKKHKDRRDRDLMLYDWGLHHLHLSTIVDRDAFVVRTEDLLFVGFLAKDAYLIDVAPHGSWYLRSLLETIVLNWPRSGLLTSMKGVTGLTTTYTEQEGLELREAGVAANMLEFQGGVWVPRDFVTTAGTSGRATRRADFILTEARRLERLIQTDPHAVLDDMEKAVGPIQSPRFHFAIYDHDYGIFEESKDVFLCIGTLAE